MDKFFHSAMLDTRVEEPVVPCRGRHNSREIKGKMGNRLVTPGDQNDSPVNQTNINIVVGATSSMIVLRRII